MKQCTTFRRTLCRASDLTDQVRRASYDKGSLTVEVLRQKVEAGLSGGAHGKPIKIDTEAKTVSTDAGDLPISPLFDPEWIRARRQVTMAKEPAGPRLGRFRRKLGRNPYAHALATPIRQCPNSATHLPRYFLQDFEMVRHPTTGAAWWAPGPLTFEHVKPSHRTKNASNEDDQALEEEEEARRSPTGGSSMAAGSNIKNQILRSRRGPITAYALNSKALVDVIGGPNKKHAALLIAVRTGMAIAPSSKHAVWREDMGDLLLQMMRRRVVEALIARGNGTPGGQDEVRFLQPCGGWEEVGQVRRRGCVLWLPETRDAAPGAKGDAGPAFATLDVDGAKYGMKMAVHNLFWLLGDQEVERLRSSASVFRHHEILVLKEWSSISMMRLHLLLWRLQGYLAET